MLKHRGQLFMWINILTSPSSGRKMNWKYYFLWMDSAAVPRTAFLISRCSVAHFIQGLVNPKLQKKRAQWNLANVVWNWWILFLIPQIKFFVPRDLLTNPIFDVCVTEKCLSNLPSPELIKHQHHRISMILDIVWYWCVILYRTPVSFISLFIILHLWVP